MKIVKSDNLKEKKFKTTHFDKFIFGPHKNVRTFKMLKNDHQGKIIWLEVFCSILMVKNICSPGELLPYANKRDPVTDFPLRDLFTENNVCNIQLMYYSMLFSSFAKFPGRKFNSRNTKTEKKIFKKFYFKNGRKQKNFKNGRKHNISRR